MTATPDLGSFGDGNGASSRRPVALWRIPPEESYSDWTIVIKHQKEESEDAVSTTDDDAPNVRTIISETYHVHRSTLALGHRASEYFKKVFASAHKETTTQTSVIKLDDTAAAVFPAVLDFVYNISAESRCEVASAKEAIAARYLANYLVIRALFDDTKRSLNNYLKSPDLWVRFSCITEAGRYQDESLCHAATRATGFIAYKLAYTGGYDHEMCINKGLYQLPVKSFSVLVSAQAERYIHSHRDHQRPVDQVLCILIRNYAKEKPEGLTTEIVTDWFKKVKNVPRKYACAMLDTAIEFELNDEIKAKCMLSWAECYEVLSCLTGSAAEDKRSTSKLDSDLNTDGTPVTDHGGSLIGYSHHWYRDSGVYYSCDVRDFYDLTSEIDRNRVLFAVLVASKKAQTMLQSRLRMRESNFDNGNSRLQTDHELLRDIVLEYIRVEGNASDIGASVVRLVHYKRDSFTELMVRTAINSLANEGRIYSTINEDHYRSIE